MKLFLDIETIPTQREDFKQLIAEDIKHPGNIKKAESIKLWNKEKKPQVIDEAWRKTALDATQGELLCFGYAFNDDEPECLGRTLEQPESVLLEAINDTLGNRQSSVWIGHYITGFDLRYLWLRFVVNGIKPAFNIPYNAKPWDSSVFDTKVEWSGLKGCTSGSLDIVSKALGYKGKGDLDGSKVWDAVLEGRYEEIFEYCKDDVNKARTIYNRMMFK